MRATKFAGMNVGGGAACFAAGSDFGAGDVVEHATTATVTRSVMPSQFVYRLYLIMRTSEGFLSGSS